MTDRSQLKSSRGNRPCRVGGFSLLEVMIALFVLSIGLLGIAGMQVTSKRTNYEAQQRVTATTLAQGLLERIRTNSGQLGVYTNGGAGYTLTGSTMSSVTCTSAAPCTAANLALYDLYQWEQSMSGVAETQSGTNAGGLPFPIGCITVDAANANHITVAVAWRGLVKLSNPAINSCGSSSGLYDDGANANVYRRILVLDTFIQ